MDTQQDTMDVHAQGKDHVRTQQEGSHLQDKGRERSEEINPADTLILDFQPLELQENKFLLFK